MRDAQIVADALPGATRRELPVAMRGNDEEARRERRHALAIQFAKEVSTWSAERLRQVYAQPEYVRAAEQYGTLAKAMEAAAIEAAQREHEDQVGQSEVNAARRSSVGGEGRRRRKS